MSWLIPVLSFIGAGVGAAGTVWVTRRGQKQDARTEWRTRLEGAIELVRGDGPIDYRLGQIMLTELINSDLGSDADHELAREIADVSVTSDLDQDYTSPSEDDPLDRDRGRSDTESEATRDREG